MDFFHSPLAIPVSIPHLPGGQTQETAHGEDGEIEDSAVGGLVGVSHLLLK